MNKAVAPILLFVYNRPWHTRQTLEALEKNPLAAESRLYIFADGPKENCSPEQLEKINEVRAFIREKKWCGEVEIIEREKNLGIEVSEVSAITEKIAEHGKVIVLEDDIVTGQGFLTYMNRALDLYENTSNVYGVSGYQFPIQAPVQELALLPFTSVWGWGTWKKKWEIYSPHMAEKDTIFNNPWLSSRFNIGDSDHTGLFYHPHNPWDIRWYYSVFSRNGLFVFPSQSMVSNIGMDGSGIHYTINSGEPRQPFHHNPPDVVLLQQINFKIYAQITRFLQKKKLTFWQRAISFIRKHF